MNAQQSTHARLTTLAAVLLIAVSLTALARPQTPAAPAEPTWADQSEYDVGMAAENEKDPSRQLILLKKWEQQYPESALKNRRTLLTTHALLNIIGAGFSTGKASVDAGHQAAQELLDHFNTYFDPAVRPAAWSVDQWAGIKKNAGLQAHALLARIAVAASDDATAESEYRKILAIDPTQAATSYQLGAVIIHEIAATKDISRFPEALYHLARSLAVTGPNALPPAGKEAAGKALQTKYAGYHGDTNGLDDLMKQAQAAAMPPPGFHILSAQEIADAKQQQHDIWAAQHPDLDFWQRIQAALTSQGDDYFSGSLRGVAFPPPPSDAYKGPALFQGVVVAVPSPNRILVNVDNAAGDAILKLDENLKGEVPAGTAIRFKGVVDSWTKEPNYALTFEIPEPKTDIEGLPAGVTFVPEQVKPVRPAPHSAAPRK